MFGNCRNRRHYYTLAFGIESWWRLFIAGHGRETTGTPRFRGFLFCCAGTRSGCGLTTPLQPEMFESPRAHQKGMATAFSEIRLCGWDDAMRPTGKPPKGVASRCSWKQQRFEDEAGEKSTDFLPSAKMRHSPTVSWERKNLSVGVLFSWISTQVETRRTLWQRPVG